MLELNYALNLIVKGIESTTDKIGLKVEYPEGVRPPEAPVATDGKKSFVMFRGEKGRIRIEYTKISLHYTLHLQMKVMHRMTICHVYLLTFLL